MNRFAAALAAVVFAASAFAQQPIAEKRDPFEPPKNITPPSPVCTAALGRDFALDDMQLVAIVSSTANPLAMVTDPSGEGHILKRGSRVARECYSVTRITAHEVILQ